jgi:hypothetical protein
MKVVASFMARSLPRLAPQWHAQPTSPDTDQPCDRGCVSSVGIAMGLDVRRVDMDGVIPVREENGDRKRWFIAIFNYITVTRRVSTADDSNALHRRSPDRVPDRDGWQGWIRTNIIPINNRALAH